MDHFETIVCDLLETSGYWVRRSFKVEMTKEEKRKEEEVKTRIKKDNGLIVYLGLNYTCFTEDYPVNKK